MRKAYILRIILSCAGIAAATAAFVSPACAVQSKLHFAPAFLLLSAGLSLGAAAVLAIHALTALLFGRIYCAVFCPLGVLQDFIGFITRRKAAADTDRKVLRYFLAAAAFGLALAGFARLLGIFDPFSRYGAMAATLLDPLLSFLLNSSGIELEWNVDLSFVSILLGGILPLLIIFMLTVWKKRIYCTSLCPVGTVLGLLGAQAFFRMRLNKDKCIECGKCVSVCPAGCIDIPGKKLDNERCLRCFSCGAACPVKAISFGRSKAKESDPERRRLIVAAAAVMAGSWFMGRFIRRGNTPSGAESSRVFPPGAGSAARFKARCTGCLLCVANCPGKVLTPPDGDAGSVHLDFTRGMCEYNCSRCNNICPAGALRPLKLKEKRITRIGMAEFLPQLCIAVQDGIHCGACAEHCPTGALRMVQEDDFPCPIPRLNPELCIGCGNCVTPCPVRPVRAMKVNGVALQTLTVSPEEYFRKNAPAEPEKPSTGGEWLI